MTTPLPTIPRRLRPGDRVRVIAPSRTLTCIEEGSPIGPQSTALAIQRLEELGLRVEFGRHLRGHYPLDNAPRAGRLDDLHEAFADPGVAAILTVIGGFNANGLLPDIDWELIRAHPKVLCGYSDISALQNAMLARADMVSWSGPHFSTFGMRDGLEFTLAAFRRALFEEGPYDLPVSPTWSDDPWFLDQDARTFHPNPGPWVIQPGEAEGQIVGANLSTFHLLMGTPYKPDLNGALLFIEAVVGPPTFARMLQGVLQQPDAQGIRGLVIGRFQPGFGMTPELLWHILQDMPQLAGLPIVAGLDFGHTTPHLTLPIGGQARLEAGEAGVRVRVLRG